VTPSGSGDCGPVPRRGAPVPRRRFSESLGAAWRGSPAAPVARSSPLVREGDDQNECGVEPVDDRVGKSSGQYVAARVVLDQRPALRSFNDPLESSPDCVFESGGGPAAPLQIPSPCFAQIALRSRKNLQLTRHSPDRRRGLSLQPRRGARPLRLRIARDGARSLRPIHLRAPHQPVARG
jgi:hypothetical protein